MKKPTAPTIPPVDQPVVPTEVDEPTELVRLCLQGMKADAQRIVTGQAEQKRALTSDESDSLCKYARAAAVVRTRAKADLDDDATYEELLEQAKQFPELMDALGLGGKK